jgi:hypothetical protein
VTRARVPGMTLAAVNRRGGTRGGLAGACGRGWVLCSGIVSLSVRGDRLEVSPNNPQVFCVSVLWRVLADAPFLLGGPGRRVSELGVALAIGGASGRRPRGRVEPGTSDGVAPWVRVPDCQNDERGSLRNAVATCKLTRHSRIHRLRLRRRRTTLIGGRFLLDLRSAAFFLLSIAQVRAVRAVGGRLRPHFARGDYARTRGLIFSFVPGRRHQPGEARARILRRSRASNNTRLDG